MEMVNTAVSAQITEGQNWLCIYNIYGVVYRSSVTCHVLKNDYAIVL